MNSVKGKRKSKTGSKTLGRTKKQDKQEDVSRSKKKNKDELNDAFNETKKEKPFFSENHDMLEKMSYTNKEINLEPLPATLEKGTSVIYFLKICLERKYYTNHIITFNKTKRILSV
jgi:hypothetical protein